jgi:hypothetical protein
MTAWSLSWRRFGRPSVISMIAFLGHSACVVAEPLLQAGVCIQDGGSPLAVDIMSAPTVVDWNNDGRKDLVAGQFSYGKIKVYLNQNTDAAPVFDGGFFVQSGGQDVTTSYG